MIYALLVIVLATTSVFLIGVVLIQSGRGDGLSGAFGMGEGQAVFGDRAGDVLTKATTWSAVLFMLLCLAVTWQSKRSEESLLSGRGATQRGGGSSRTAMMTMEEMEELEQETKDEAEEMEAVEESSEGTAESLGELDMTDEKAVESDTEPEPQPAQ
jgi:preprotein translocase subunit SecG